MQETEDIVTRLRNERRATRWTRGADADYPVAWEPHPLCAEAATTIATLRAEVEVLRADAKRYKWLRDYHIGDDPLSINLAPAKKRGLDAAIDAAKADKEGA